MQLRRGNTSFSTHGTNSLASRVVAGLALHRKGISAYMVTAIRKVQQHLCPIFGDPVSFSRNLHLVAVTVDTVVTLPSPVCISKNLMLTTGFASEMCFAPSLQIHGRIETRLILPRCGLIRRAVKPARSSSGPAPLCRKLIFELALRFLHPSAVTRVQLQLCR